MRWEIAKTSDDREAAFLCEEGWEPYAVSYMPRFLAWPPNIFFSEKGHNLDRRVSCT